MDIIKYKSVNFAVEETITKIVFEKKDGTIEVYKLIKTGKESLRLSK